MPDHGHDWEPIEGFEFENGKVYCVRESGGEVRWLQAYVFLDYEPFLYRFGVVTGWSRTSLNGASIHGPLTPPEWKGD